MHDMIIQTKAQIRKWPLLEKQAAAVVPIINTLWNVIVHVACDCDGSSWSSWLSYQAKHENDDDEEEEEEAMYDSTTVLYELSYTVQQVHLLTHGHYLQ